MKRVCACGLFFLLLFPCASGWGAAVSTTVPVALAVTPEGLGCTTLQACIDAINVSGVSQNDATIARTLRISALLLVDAATTVSTSIGLDISGPGRLDCQNVHALTINGPFVAPHRQVFVNCGSTLATFGGRGFLGKITPMWWGAIGNDTGDQTTALQASLNAVSTTFGGNIEWPLGSYNITGTLSWPVVAQPVTLWAYGARLVHLSGSSGPTMLMRGVGPTNSSYRKWTVFGLEINNALNSTATYGISIENAYHVALYDVQIHSGGNAADYACLRLGQQTVGDTASGALWIHTYNFLCQKNASTVPVGILIEGHTNAINIYGGQLTAITTGIKIADQSGGDGAIPNGVLIEGVDFETNTTNILVTSSLATASIAGLRFIGNRSENVGVYTFFSFTGITTQPTQPPYIAGNYMQQGVASTYINNPNSLILAMWDFGYPVAGLGSVPDYAPAIIPSEVLYQPTDTPITCATALKGTIYYDASLNEMCFCNATNWCKVSAPATCSSPTSCG